LSVSNYFTFAIGTSINQVLLALNTSQQGTYIYDTAPTSGALYVDGRGFYYNR